MALRNLAAKVRIPVAARLPPVSRVSPASGSRALPFSSSSSTATERARERYLTELKRYESLTRELKRYRIEVLLTERFGKLLTWTYRLFLPCAIGATAVRATGFRPRPRAVKD